MEVGCSIPCRYSYDYSKYKPYIVEHESDPKKLFCIVTKTSVNKVGVSNGC